MARMVRKQIVIPAEQERALGERAAALGVSQSSLVRDAIEQLLGGVPTDVRRKRAWDGLRAGMADSGRLGVGSRGTTWTRDQLHER